MPTLQSEKLQIKYESEMERRQNDVQMRPTFSPRRLLALPPHHGEWQEPGRAVRRGAAHGNGARDASSTSHSEGQPDQLAATSNNPFPLRPASAVERSDGGLLFLYPLLLLLLLLFLARGSQKKFRGKSFKNMQITRPTPLCTKEGRKARLRFTRQ